MADHALIESVLIPASPSFYGEISDRHTLCISTQVGCAYGCKFCASGLEGWKRNLRVDGAGWRAVFFINLAFMALFVFATPVA